MESEDNSKAAPELPLLEKPRQDVVFVDTAQGLARAVASMAAASGPFAIDSERASGFKYSQRAYLIQIYRRGSSIFLIDPISISPDNDPMQFSELSDLLKTDLWLLHAATQDMPCLEMLGLRPTSLFDTELASRIVNLERVGLGSVCENLLGIRLAKEHSAVDWSQRPLDAAWLTYAALDVDVLHDLYEALSKLLEEQQKTDWANQEFDALTNFKPKPAKLDRWRGTSGAIELKDQQSLAMLREIWNAREALAQKLDVSPGRILPDRSMIAAILSDPKTKPELLSLKSFSGRGSRTFIDIWFSALRAGAETRDLPPRRLPADGIPNHRHWPQKFPEAAQRLQLAKNALSELALELNIPVENLISPDHVRQVCWQLDLHEAQEISIKLIEAGARKWQASAASVAIEAAFANQNSLDSDRQ
ncbi:MAG: hypothetical protein RL174_79 [Actinomycetota bacterium]|jgi:ribonuclease D